MVELQLGDGYQINQLPHTIADLPSKMLSPMEALQLPPS